MGNYIKIDRKILDWEWYKNEHTKNVFFHCLLKANWSDGKFQGKIIPRGSFVSSIGNIASDLDLTVDEVRTAISHLLKTGELTKQTTNRFTVFTVSNYELYQDATKQIPNNSQTDTKQIPNKSQTIPKLFPTIEEEKEGKKNKELEEEQEEKEKGYRTVSNETVCQTDVRLVVDAWNGLSEYGVQPVSRITPSSKRYQSLVARIREYNTADVLSAIEKIKDSDFLRGKNKKGWTITFDWFVLPNNFPKVLEGNYNNKSSQSSEESEWLRSWRDA